MGLRKTKSFVSISSALVALVVTAAGCGLAGTSPSSTVPAAPASGAVTAGTVGSTLAQAPRAGSLAEALQARNGQDRASIDLAATYLQRARDNGDPSYYPKVEGLVNSALAKNPNDPDALTLMGMLSLGRHQFADALAWGQKARDASQDSTNSLGVIGDAQIEMGNYDAAVRTFQSMVDQRPDLSSYARVSYARELYGDVPGAIIAMQQAIEAGGRVPENVAYPTVILGNLYFDSGDLDRANTEYQSALAIFPNYVHATAGEAKVQAARGNFPEAIRLYQDAINRYPLPDYVIALGDVYTVSGDPNKAGETYDLAAAEQKLYQANGINVDAELALFQADHHRDLTIALDAAQRAIQVRGSVVTADVLGWTLFQQGRYQEALSYAHQAGRIGTRSALFAFHQGMIEDRLGQTEAARADLARALSINPYFSPIHAPEARQVLASLGGAPAVGMSPDLAAPATSGGLQ